MVTSPDLSLIWTVLVPLLAFIPFAVGMMIWQMFPHLLPLYKKTLVWGFFSVAFIAAGYLTFQSLAPLPVRAYGVVLILTVLPTLFAAAVIHILKLETSLAAPFALGSSFLVGVLLLPGSNLGIALLLALGTIWLLKTTVQHQLKKAA